MSADEATVESNRLLQAAGAIVNAAVGTPVHRELFFHDTLCTMTEYTLSTPECYSASGPLLHGAGVCQGYSEAFALLCRMSGIPCSMVSGTGRGVPHEWNVVVLNGTPVLVDVTWDDQVWGTPHWYFNVPAAKMAASHIQDDGFAAPECISNAYSYGSVWGENCGSEEELLDLLPAAMKRFANGSAV